MPLSEEEILKRLKKEQRLNKKFSTVPGLVEKKESIDEKGFVTLPRIIDFIVCYFNWS